MNRRINLNDVRLLMQVIEHGSYTAAARAIGVPKSTISQRIAALEAAVGTGLLRRTSRSFSLTEAGSQLLPHVRAIEALARQLEQSLMERDGALQGTLRISCSHAIAQFALAPIMPRFLAEHERVTINVESNNRLVDLVGENFDMVVRGHVEPLRDSTLIQRVVARTPWLLAASPAWVEAHGAPETPEAIGANQTLRFSRTPDWQVWPLKRDGIERRVEVTPSLISDDMLLLRGAAVAGGGIVCLPAYLLKPFFAAGELVRVLPDWECQTSVISVLTPPKLQSSRLAAAFSSFLAAELPAATRC